MTSSAASLVTLVCFAQAAAPTAELPVSVDRIQRELARPAAEEPLKIPHVFRMTIEGRQLGLRAPWDPANDTLVPAWVRPQMPIYHYEFLMMVTPEAFRAGALYPIPISRLLDPAAERLADRIRQAWLRRREARARREVDEALRQLLEARERLAREKKEAEKNEAAKK